MLLKMTEDSNGRIVNEGLDVPAETARREMPQPAIAQATAKIEECVRRGPAAEQLAYGARCALLEDRRAAGKKPQRPESVPPRSAPKDANQVDLAVEESRAIPGSGFRSNCARRVQELRTDRIRRRLTQVKWATAYPEQTQSLVWLARDAVIHRREYLMPDVSGA